jgi:hypothetical protein
VIAQVAAPVAATQKVKTALFTVNTRFAVCMAGEGSEASYVLEGERRSRQCSPI